MLKAIIKAKRNGLYRLVPADEPTRLDCLMDKCAKCCKCLGSPVVTSDEAAHIDKDAICNDKHGVFIKSSHSTCSLLEKGLCSIHPVRPRGCREYPWYNIDGQLYYDSGCPGIRHDVDERPQTENIQLFRNFFPGVSAITYRIIKHICAEFV